MSYTEELRLDPDFDARWSTWQARGRVHERAVRRRLVVLAPAMLIAAAIIWVLVIR